MDKKSNINAAPLVSVLLPCYNRPAGLDDALHDFTSQTYTNVEIIVSDNCSPQKEAMQRVMAKYADDPRIRYTLQKENIGMLRNSLDVLQKAKGEYIIFASDDDRWDKDFVFELFTLLKKNPDASCAFCDYDVISPEGHKRTDYPEAYPFLKEFDDPDRISRLKKFILAKEGYSNKSCPIRALIKTEIVQGYYRKMNDFGLFENWGDMLVVFAFLMEGRLVTSPRVLHKFTVGNSKDYFRTPPNAFYYLEGYLKLMHSRLPPHEVEILSEYVGMKLRQTDCPLGGKELVSTLKSISSILQISDSIIDMQDIENLNHYLQTNENCAALRVITKIFRKFTPAVIMQLLEAQQNNARAS
ncbi:glycosyltransferase [Maridesulfovibrio ferrireducens]|uniref:glycosyltransferase family 2 protein n=1 Tax=Maridesulfovibrio ferrireducens TaxID=246191 RepID=UPI001A2760DA|nr:glycosyltransferase [Maridesulfovibrio ferrireducens]MBI9113106.1 glycosyltransferase [Maridesulfovibrio ferrireducens]